MVEFKDACRDDYANPDVKAFMMYAGRCGILFSIFGFHVCRACNVLLELGFKPILSLS